MLSAGSFSCFSLRASPHGEAVERILMAAIHAVEPAAVVGRCLSREGNLLKAAGQTYDLDGFRRVRLLGIGKASQGMAEATAQILGDRMESGLVITKHAAPTVLPNLTVSEGDHPIPGTRSLQAGDRVNQFMSTLEADDLLICLVSGGGSALVSLPGEGISLGDLQALTAEMLGCGAAIEEINTLRRRFDRLKGGGILKLANRAQVITLLLSDVVGNAPEAIASGPLAPDPGTRQDALRILRRYDLDKRLPASIINSIKTSPETPKPGDPLFARSQTILAGSNLQAAQGALKQAKEEGFHPHLLRTDLSGDARQAAFELATLLRQSAQTGEPVPRPGCIIAGGETTVRLCAAPGKGGRNTELALVAVSELADFPDVMLIALATDGEDGNSESAGAVVTGDTRRRGMDMGIQPGDFLQDNDSATYFGHLGDLLLSGPTGTNVNDLVFLLSF